MSKIPPKTANINQMFLNHGPAIRIKRQIRNIARMIKRHTRNKNNDVPYTLQASMSSLGIQRDRESLGKICCPAGENHHQQPLRSLFMTAYCLFTAWGSLFPFGKLPSRACAVRTPAQGPGNPPTVARRYKMEPVYIPAAVASVYTQGAMWREFRWGIGL